jgi:hypothetical protein
LAQEQILLPEKHQRIRLNKANGSNPLIENEQAKPLKVKRMHDTRAEQLSKKKTLKESQ